MDSDAVAHPASCRFRHTNLMHAWLSDPNTPAWVQAVGSVIAILVAVWVPARQRSNSLRDAIAERERQRKEHLKRVTAGLRAEIGAAIEASDRQQFTIDRTLKRLKEAQRKGMEIKDTGPIPAGSMMLTDAIVYQQIAAELGQLPTELVTSIVTFYTFALELGRIADHSSNAANAYQTVRPLLPRLRMNAAMLIRMLEKFESSGFDPNSKIQSMPEEIRELAAKVGYPLDEILKERGLNIG